MTEPVDVLVLGRIGVRCGGAFCAPSSAISRAVLAALALAGPEGLATDQLFGVVWGTRQAQSVESTVSVAVHRLRRWLRSTAGDRVAVRWAGSRYVLEIPDGSVDALRARQLVTSAGSGPPADRAAQLARALALWRGPALVDVPAGSVDTVAAADLEQLHLQAAVEYGQALLAVGDPRPAVEVLGALAHSHPFDERLTAVWIEVLAAVGRQAESLDVYESMRTRLRDELGADPGPDLSRALLRVLRQQVVDVGAASDEPAGAAAEASRDAQPRQLPATVVDFTGRGGLVNRLCELLVAGRYRPAVVVSAIAGRGGVGKSTLALHVAHLVRERYHGGQLYVDLRGTEPQPAQPGEVLVRFLRALGVPGTAIPDSIEERAAMYRSRVADHAVLVVLDNAATEEQILPLLPGAADCAVIVTSRSRLVALPGTHLVEVDVLDLDEARDLLTAIIGADRVAAEPAAADDLATLCGRLPLALRIAGARLAARSHWSLAGFADRLRDHRRRLDELRFHGLEVRASIDLSYQGLDPLARRLFSLLGLLAAADFHGWVAAALLDAPPTEAGEALDRLVDAQLIDVARVDEIGLPRYRFHDLVRDYARERAELDHDEAARTGAVGRALGGWLAVAEQVHREYYAGDHTIIHSDAPRWRLDPDTVKRLIASPPSWYESERSTLLAEIRQAADLGLVTLCWDLAASCVMLYQLRHDAAAWLESHHLALTVAREAGDRRGEAAMHGGLAALYLQGCRYQSARRHVTAALRLFAEQGEHQGYGNALRNLATEERMTGRFEDALRHLTEAESVLRAAGDHVGVIHVQRQLAQVHSALGDDEDALRHLRSALALAERTGVPRVAAQVRYYLGELHLRRRELAAADDAFSQVATVCAELSDRIGEGFALLGLGALRLRQGRPDDAERYLTRSLRQFSELDLGEHKTRSLLRLAELHNARGEHDRAMDRLTEALAIQRHHHLAPGQVRTLTLLGDVHRARGVPEAARHAWQEALTLAGNIGAAAEVERLRARLAASIPDMAPPVGNM